MWNNSRLLKHILVHLRMVKNKASKPVPFLFHRTIPHRMWKHFWKVSTQGLFVAVFWPFIPQFVCNCLFYWALYFNPIINIDLVVKEIRRLETQVQWLNELLSWLVSKNACLKETLCFVLFCFSFIMWQWK